ncbi:MAG: response regulator [Bacteroidetes bacterium]|nr:response regulator [Bacteroidota bacterium]
MSVIITRQRHILIVEDDGDICLLMEILLQSSDVTIRRAKTLAAAQEALEEDQPDVVVLDNRLPDGFGIDLISTIKKKYPAVKVMMVTGVDHAAQDLALEVGADAFLAKPFTKEQLVQSIRSLLTP